MKKFCAVVSIALGLCFRAEALTDGAWSFTVANGEATLTGYSGEGPADLVLPSTVTAEGTSYTVTAVGSSAFSSRNWIKSILIPATITNLANNVFHSCSGITNAVILAQADVIDLGMFPEQSVDFDTLVISGNGRTRLVHSYDSYAQRPRHVRISGVRELGEGCFKNYPNLEDVTFDDDSLRIIGNEAFYGNIGNSAFYDCTNLCAVTLSTNLLSIGNSAFRNTKLSTVDIPDRVKNMGEWAFGGCNAMTNAVIGSGLETLPNYAFGYNYAFQSIEIPSTLTNISNNAFSNCKALREVVWNTDAETLNGDIFGGQTNWVSLVILGVARHSRQRQHDGEGLFRQGRAERLDFRRQRAARPRL